MSFERLRLNGDLARLASCGPDRGNQKRARLVLSLERGHGWGREESVVAEIACGFGSSRRTSLNWSDLDFESGSLIDNYNSARTE